MVALVVFAAGGYYLWQHRSAPPAPPTPPELLQVAAARSAASTSASATFSTQVSGLTVMVGTIREQLRPVLMADLKMTTVDGADRFSVEEIITGSDVYVQVPGLAGEVGKPWLDVPVAQLDADPALDELYQTAAIPTSMAGVLAAVTTARQAGTARVDGVSTRRYVGTVDPAAALTALSPAVRQLLAPKLTAASGPISFVAWLDGRDNFRKIQTTATIGGRSTVTTVVFTTSTKPVALTAPAASEVTAGPSR